VASAIAPKAAQTAAEKAQTAAEKAQTAAEKARTAAETAAEKAKTEAKKAQKEAVEIAQTAAQQTTAQQTAAQRAQIAAQTAQAAAQTAQTAAAGATPKSDKIGIPRFQLIIIAILIALLCVIIYLVLSDKKKQINSFTNSEIALLKKSIQYDESIQYGATIPSVKVESRTATTNVTRNIDRTPNDPTSKINETTLTDWWKTNATKSSSECMKGLIEKFGEESNPIGLIDHPEQKDDWKVLNITGTKQFLIPCKHIVYDDFIMQFFDVHGSSYVIGLSLITSLILPAIKDSTDNISRGMLDVKTPHVGSEPIRQPVITEPKGPVLDEKKLIDWWDKNSTSELTKCKNSLKEKFGNEIEVVLIDSNENSDEDWYVIGIEEPLSQEVYVLPRQRILIRNIELWFETSNKISKRTLIKSLVRTARSARSSPKKMMTRGKITIAEE
jgi:chemotaxis protein histidine kinase CheA